MNANAPLCLRLKATLAIAFALMLSGAGAGQYNLAYWREVGSYENAGNHSAYVHVWDENGQPLAGKQIYTSWGVLLGTTDANGFVEIVLLRPNGYDFQVRDGVSTSDTTPVLSVERPPNWGHYSFEVGFLYQRTTGNAGLFDTNYFGIVNASGADSCLDLSAPCMASLAYYSTSPTGYCSDQYELGTWTASHGQTFVARGNRIVAVKGMMAAGYNVHYYWTAQVFEGGPTGTPIGPARSTRLMVDGEYFPILVKWAVNEVQVVPGRTYYLRITATGGLNVWRVNRNNYANGNYYQNDVAVSGSELMGLVVCASYTNAGPLGQLSGSVRDAGNNPIGGAVVSVLNPPLYATTASDGSYTLPLVPAGTYDVSATRGGYTAGLNRGIIVNPDLTTACNFNLSLQSTNMGSGIVTNGASYLQPFETLPTWTSSFDASWGSTAAFSLEASGQTGNALQATRTGPGSSARVQVFPVRPNTPYSVSVWIRCPSFSSPFWAECAYKAGNFSAQDFDGNSGTWTLIRKFSDTGENGNGNVWRQYRMNFTSAGSGQVSIGFKLGASTGTGPTVRWDQLAIVCLALPGVAGAVAESPENVTVHFAEPVNESAATNVANYSLSGAGVAVPLLQAMLFQKTNVALATARQTKRVDYTLSVSNVINSLQPATVTGLNGLVGVRVPLSLITPGDATLWKYEQSGSDLSTAWRASTYDDSGWPSGAALFAQSSVSLPEPIRTALSTAPGRVTYYFRRPFLLPAGITNAQLRLRTLVADGAIFWLNNAELFRLGITNTPAFFTTPASRSVALPAYEGPFDVGAPGLAQGTNMLAVEVHRRDPAGSQVVFGAEVEALVLPSQLPFPVLQFERVADALSLNWSDPALSLEMATNVGGPWILQPGVASSAVFPMTNTTGFFRLRE
ncbi:MAG TPA: carboxypeptidase-like regulatory domain-containing protein [Verrucomicrobiae bacterium]